MARAPPCAATIAFAIDRPRPAPAVRLLVPGGGIPVPSMTDFNQVMQDRRPGDSVTVVWRDAAGATRSAAAVLSAGPPA